MLYTHSWGTFFFAGSAISLIPALIASDDRRGLLRDAVIRLHRRRDPVPAVGARRCSTRSPTPRRRGTTSPRFGAPVQLSRDVLGGDRITMVLVIPAAIGLAPLFTRAHRRTREWARLWTLVALPVATLGIAWLGSQVDPALVARYFAPVIGAHAAADRLGLRPRAAAGHGGDRAVRRLPGQPQLLHAPVQVRHARRRRGDEPAAAARATRSWSASPSRRRWPGTTCPAACSFANTAGAGVAIRAT